MKFEEGQRYVNGLGRQLTILAVDTVSIVDRRPVTVLAYRYDGRDSIHLRAAHRAENWEKL